MNVNQISTLKGPFKSLMSGSLSALQHYLADFFHQLYVASSCCIHRLQSFRFWMISWLDYCYLFLIGLLSLPLECIHNGVAQFWLFTAPQIRIMMVLLGYKANNSLGPYISCRKVILFTQKNKQTCHFVCQMKVNNKLARACGKNPTIMNKNAP